MWGPVPRKREQWRGDREEREQEERREKQQDSSEIITWFSYRTMSKKFAIHIKHFTPIRFNEDINPNGNNMFLMRILLLSVFHSSYKSLTRSAIYKSLMVIFWLFLPTTYSSQTMASWKIKQVLGVKTSKKLQKRKARKVDYSTRNVLWSLLCLQTKQKRENTLHLSSALSY